METFSLFSIFENKANLDILNTLKNKSLTKTELIEKIPISSLGANLTKLKNLGLVEQKQQKFLLNKKGNLILQKIFLMNFISKNNQYFLTHDFGDVPPNMISKINCMHECELVMGTFPTVSRLKNIVNNAQKFLYCIFTQPPFLLADPIYDKISNDVDLFLLFGKNSDVPDCNDLVEKLELDKPKQHKFKQRISENIQINIITSENQACVMLPDRNGVTDMQNCIIGNSTDFIKWCHDFFNYKWESSESFSRLRDF